VTRARAPERLRIGAVEERTGLSRDTIHYYVKEGLVHAPEKTAATVAWYDARHVARLKSIRALRAAGLPLAAVRRLLSDPSIVALPLSALEALGLSLAAVKLEEVPRAPVCSDRARALAARLRLADRLDENPALCDALDALVSALEEPLLTAVERTLVPSLRAFAAAELDGDSPVDPASISARTQALAVALGPLANAFRAEAIARRASARARSSKRSDPHEP
jgi:DNA-binding transcriptional MerR regulator